jgi:hypothetical protein
MVIDMDEAQVRTVEQVRQVLEGTRELQFRAAEDDEGRYGWIDSVLRRLGYRQLGRSDRGAVLAYLPTPTAFRLKRRVPNLPAAEKGHAATAPQEVSGRHARACVWCRFGPAGKEDDAHRRAGRR